jgi:hypothetical protein
VQELCKYIERREKHYNTSWQIGNCNKDNNSFYVWCSNDYIVQARNANTTKEQKEVALSCKLVCLFACLLACVKDHMMNTKTIQENTKLVKKIKANKQFEQQTNIKQMQ